MGRSASTARLRGVLAVILVVLTTTVAAAAVAAPAQTPSARAVVAPTLPIELAERLNATCTAPQGNSQYLATECTAGNGTSFVAESMPGPGRLTVRGIDFVWPGQSDFYFPPGGSGTKRYDSIVDAAEPVALGDRQGYRAVALLVAGLGDQVALPYTVEYADGSTVTRNLWLRDWAAPQEESDIPGTRIQQGALGVDNAKGQGAIKVLLVEVDPARALRSITLPPGTLTYAISLTNQRPSGSKGGPVDGPSYGYQKTELRYSRPGPWEIEELRTDAACDSSGNLCTIYLPTSREGRRRVPPGGFPVVVWANGTGVATERYEYFLRHLASWGFVVASSDDTGTANGTTAIDVAHFVIDSSRETSSPLQGKVDADEIGVSGHSQGGGAVVGLYARQDAPFSAYVAIHPAPSYFCALLCDFASSDLATADTGAILFMQSVGDGGAGDTENYYNQSSDSATKALGVTSHGKHDDVMGTPHCVGGNCITGVYAYLGYATAWFTWHLAGEASLQRAFRSREGEWARSDPDWKLRVSNID